MSFYQFNTHLTLHADPVKPMHAVTKRYVDAKAGAVDGSRFQIGTLSPDKLPALQGDVTSLEGTNEVFLSNTGVTPGVKYRVDVDSKGRVVDGALTHHTEGRKISWSWVTGKPSTLAGYGITDVISTTGGTVSGTLSSTVDASASNHAVRKSQVDTMITNLSLAAASTGDMVRSASPITPTGFFRANGGVLSKTDYAGLYAAIGDNYNVNDTGGFGYMGQPWQQQFFINTGTNGANLTWSNETGLPKGVFAHQVAVTKNRVYVLAGHFADGQASILTAPIDSNGNLGTWSSAGTMPANLGRATIIITKNRLYVLGGLKDYSPSALVYTAAINSDGTLGSWTTSTSLPVGIWGLNAFVTKNRVYVTSGLTNEMTAPSWTYNKTVYTAVINSDGTLGTWTTAGSTLYNCVDSPVLVTKNKVYIFNARNADLTANSSVQVAPINADGTLGTWVAGASSPVANYDPKIVATNNRAYFIGGVSSDGVLRNTIYSTTIAADGTLGAWTQGTSFNTSVAFMQVFVTSSKLYIVGGISTTWSNADDYKTIQGSTVIQSAPFAGGANDYLAVIANNTVDPTRFKLPDWTAKETDKLYYYVKY